MWLIAVIIGAVILLVAGAVIVMVARLDAATEVDKRPRKPMEWCHVHGFFLPEHALSLPGTEVKICPQCWVDSYKAAGGKAS